MELKMLYFYLTGVVLMLGMTGLIIRQNKKVGRKNSVAEILILMFFTVMSIWNVVFFVFATSLYITDKRVHGGLK